MGRSDADHAGDGAGRAGVRGTLALVVVLLLVAGGVVVVREDLLARWLGGPDRPTPAGPAEPDRVAPPPGVDAPPVLAPPPVADASPETTRLDPAAVRAALAPYLDDADLGRHTVVSVGPIDGGPVVGIGRGTAIPASTTKVVTGVAALLALGPDHVFTTEVRAAAGRVVLVGGGDPFLERGPLDLAGEEWPYPVRADLATLAEQTADALRADGRRRVRVGYDDTLFTGPAANPTWEPDYVPSAEVSPTSALWVDEGLRPDGFGRLDDSAGAAAAAFVEALEAQGIRVAGAPQRGRADGEVLAAVDSAPVDQIVQRVLEVSDNEGAEVLLRHVGLAVSGVGSTDAGAAGVRRVLADAGIRMGASRLYDGSGLSRRNRLDPALLVDVVRLAADPARPGLRAVVAGLPVAGFSGSLADRMDAGPPAGLGRVRAKTGTLSNVSTLAGLATGLDGEVMAFALMSDRIAELDFLDAQQTLDSAAAALGACACGSGR